MTTTTSLAEVGGLLEPPFVRSARMSAGSDGPALEPVAEEGRPSLDLGGLPAQRDTVESLPSPTASSPGSFLDQGSGQSVASGSPRCGQSSPLPVPPLGKSSSAKMLSPVAAGSPPENGAPVCRVSLTSQRNTVGEFSEVARRVKAVRFSACGSDDSEEALDGEGTAPVAARRKRRSRSMEAPRDMGKVLPPTKLECGSTWQSLSQFCNLKVMNHPQNWGYPTPYPYHST